MPAIYEMIPRHKDDARSSSIPACRRFVFQALWRPTRRTLPIALHHGSSMSRSAAKVEAAMVEGRLKAVACTGTLDPRHRLGGMSIS